MAEKPPKGLGKLARRRRRLLTLVESKRAQGDLVMSEHYRIKAEESSALLRVEGACLRCGRKLKDPESRERGYGAECSKFIEGLPNPQGET